MTHDALAEALRLSYDTAVDTLWSYAPYKPALSHPSNLALLMAPS